MPPRFPSLPYGIALALLFIIALAPVAVTSYASAVAESHGCVITAQAVTPCVVDGIDKGPELHQLGLSFWYVLFTWPAAIVGTAIWLGILMWHRGRWKQRMYPDAFPDPRQ